MITLHQETLYVEAPGGIHEDLTQYLSLPLESTSASRLSSHDMLFIANNLQVPVLLKKYLYARNKRIKGKGVAINLDSYGGPMENINSINWPLLTTGRLYLAWIANIGDHQGSI